MPPCETPSMESVHPLMAVALANVAVYSVSIPANVETGVGAFTLSEMAWAGIISSAAAKKGEQIAAARRKRCFMFTIIIE